MLKAFLLDRFSDNCIYKLNLSLSVQCHLSLACQKGHWVITRGEKPDCATQAVSQLNHSLDHSFYQTKGKDLRDIWHVTWSVIDAPCRTSKKWTFRSFHAVEARSLDRGLRIVKSELNTFDTSHPTDLR